MSEDARSGRKDVHGLPDITSRENTHIKTLRRLQSGSGARRSGELVCDGPKLCAEALEADVPLRFMLVSESRAAEHAALTGAAARMGCPVYTVEDSLFHSVSAVRNPQGVLLVCTLKSSELPRRLEGSGYLILDRVADPGNVGTILRTAEAFGLDGVFMTVGCADRTNPKTVRATMGSIFRLPVWECPGDEAVRLCRASGITVCAAALRPGAKPLTQARLGGAAIIIGNEAAGISDELLGLSDEVLVIPMRGRAQSLNASAAAAILIWEMALARGGGDRHGLA